MKLTRLAALAFTVIAALDCSAADIERIRKSLTEHLPKVEIGEIRPSEFAGLYEVVANKRGIFYTDEDGLIVIAGPLMDLKTNTNLTQQRLQELHKTDFSQLPLERAFVKVKGNGQRKLALFSDPDCPYCKQLEKELESVTDVTIYTFLFPLTSLHPDAAHKAQLIWCAKDRLKAWDDWMLRGIALPQVGEQCDTPITQNEALGEKLGIDGTPGIIFGNGRIAEGSMPKAQIEALLNAP